MRVQTVWARITPALVALSLALLAAIPAAAQGLGSIGQGDGRKPIEITADNGIEWQQDNKRMVARGHARAVQGNVTVNADTLTAFYRERKTGGGSEIYRLDADGSVVIFSPTEKAVGDKASYDVDNTVLVLTGNGLKLTTPDTVVTARDSLEYWEGKSMAVARGAATAVQADKHLKGEILVAHFEKDAETNANKVQRIDAFTNVEVETPTELAKGDRGVYNTETGIATLAGSVKLTKGQNQLNGGYAEVNMNTGVSRLFGGPPQSADGQRVRGLLAPDEGGPKPPLGGKLPDKKPGAGSGRSNREP